MDEDATLEFDQWSTVSSAWLAGTVVKATYGSHDKARDVTEVVRGLTGARESWQACNDTLGGDPHPGAGKVLRVCVRRPAAAQGRVFELREWEPVPSKLPGELLSASYGSPDGRRAVDVTAVAASRIRQGEPWRASNDDLGGDPCPGVGKVLRLVLAARPVGESDCPACRPERPLGGGTSLVVMVEAWEGDVLSLPSGSVGAITGCSYGGGSAWVDPRAFVEAGGLGDDGSLHVQVSNEALGGDPCPGTRKSLRVSYTIHEGRRRLADEGEWEVYDDHDVASDVEFCMSGPANTTKDLEHARRRCLLLGCGGFRLTTGTVNQFGEQDGPPGCEQLRFTQEQIRASLRTRARGPRDCTRNRALRPGIHIAPPQFEPDVAWRPGNDAAPAPWVGFRPQGEFCAVATQLCVPPDGLADSTYYMFGGFQCGYGGIQQFSVEEGTQTITFSVWDAHEGDRAHNVAVGPGAKPSNFGGEGQGVGVVYDPAGEHCRWTPGTTYTWLLRAAPERGATVFTAHIFRPDGGGWQLVGSHRRPDPSAERQGRLGSIGGFMEDAGHTAQRRVADYGPCWVQRTPGGAWEAVTRCEAGDGCSRPNKAVGVTADGRSIRLSAGGPAVPAPPGALLTPNGGFRIHQGFELKAAAPPACLDAPP